MKCFRDSCDRGGVKSEMFDTGLSVKEAASGGSAKRFLIKYLANYILSDPVLSKGFAVQGMSKGAARRILSKQLPLMGSINKRTRDAAAMVGTRFLSDPRPFLTREGLAQAFNLLTMGIGKRYHKMQPGVDALNNGFIHLGNTPNILKALKGRNRAPSSMGDVLNHEIGHWVPFKLRQLGNVSERELAQWAHSLKRDNLEMAQHLAGRKYTGKRWGLLSNARGNKNKLRGITKQQNESPLMYDESLADAFAARMRKEIGDAMPVYDDIVTRASSKGFRNDNKAIKGQLLQSIYNPLKPNVLSYMIHKTKY